MIRVKNLAIIAVILTLSIFSIPKVAKADSVAWDGSLMAPTVMRSIDGVYYYEISTPAQLAYVASTGGEWYTYNYILMSDIVINREALTYDANGNLTANTRNMRSCPYFKDFRGIFDGNGHYISGLYIKGDEYVGLFGKIDGSVKNLTVQNAYILGNKYVGGICGYSDIECAEISNCSFDGAVKGSECVAGITGATDGYSGSIIKNCVNYGSIFATKNYAGGIVGRNSSAYTASIDQCTNNGQISSQGKYVGGICGSYFWSISNCTNNGSVVGKENVGGISGSQAVAPDSCINNGAVSGENNVGGIIGITDRGGTGEFLYNTGSVTGNKNVGGIYGSTELGFDNEFVKISISGNSGEINGNNNVGGLFGYAVNVNLTDSVNTGKVTGETVVGTLIGHSETIWGRGSVTNCYYLSGVNPGVLGFGNAPEDIAGIAEAKDAEFFCVRENKTVGLHSYTRKYDSQNHWMECVCGNAMEYAEHTPNNENLVNWRCTDCDYLHDPADDTQPATRPGNNIFGNDGSKDEESKDEESQKGSTSNKSSRNDDFDLDDLTPVIVVAIFLFGAAVGVGITVFVMKKKQ